MNITSKKLNSKLVGLLTVLLTAVYLFASSAIVRAATVTTQTTNLKYETDHLSWGDVLTFDADQYEKSLYAQQNGSAVYQYYNTSQDTDSSTAPALQACNGFKYYGTVTIADKSAITAGEKLETYSVDKFYTGIQEKTAVEAPIGLDGVTIPVVTTAGTGVYSVVPDAAGTYRIYVYSPGGKPDVHYALLQDYSSNNDYVSQMEMQRSFARVAGTDWYYTELTVENLSWSAYGLSVKNDKQSNSSANSVADKNTGAYTGKISTVLNSKTYYHFYNEWTVTERWYNTVLAIRFDASVQLGPITRTGDALSVTNADSGDGTITAKNIFGEVVSFGTNYHMPVYFTAVPAGEAAFSGFTDGGGNDITLKSYTSEGEICYELKFEESAELTAKWEKQVDFATVELSGPKTATLHYYLNKSDSHAFSYGTVTEYTFTADYTDAVDADIQYSVTRDGTLAESGVLSKEGTLTLSLTTQWESLVVTFTSAYEDVERSMTFTASPSTSGLDPVARINSTDYYYLEDALEKSVSGNTVVLLKDYTFRTESRKASWGSMDGGAGYTVKSGVTMIVPYAASYDYNKESEHPYACEGKVVSTSGTGGSTPGDSDTYMTLTVPSGVNLKVASSGILSVGGTTNGVELIAGPHADVRLQNGAKLTVDGILSSCGFIYGGGNLYGNSGSEIYVTFTVNDFRGGGYVVGSAGKLSTNYGVNPITDEMAVSPFLRYSFQSIQCHQRIYKGADVIAYADLYANSTDNNSKATIISDDASKCLLALTADGAYVDISYDGNLYASTYPEVGKMYLTVCGNAEYGGLELTVDAGFETATVDTRNINFVLPYNFDLRIASGTFSIPNSIILLPGAGVTVEEGAVLNVSSELTVYDGLHDYTYGGNGSETNLVLSEYAQKYPSAKSITPSKTYPSSAVLMGGPFYGSGAADLIVNGTLNLKSGSSLGGVVQTGSSGNAWIKTASSIGTSTTTQVGVTGYFSIWGMYEYAFVGATVRTLDGQILDTATGERINIQPGLTYYPAAGTDKINSYTYDLYYYWTGTGSGTPTIKDEKTENVNLLFQGSWYNYEVPVYIVQDGQVSATPVMTRFAHGTDLTGKEYYTDAACTTPAASVTSNATLYYAGICEAKVVWADGSGETYYPTVRGALKEVTSTADSTEKDRVVVLTDLTDFGDIVAPTGEQDFIFDLNGKQMVTKGTAFTNQSEKGNLTVELSGGTVSNTGSTSPIVNLPEGCTMTLDLDGGTIRYCDGVVSADTADQAAAAIVNGGELVIRDTAGTGRMTSGLVLDIKSVTPANYVSLIRNDFTGNLELSDVTLESVQEANSFGSYYNTVVFNGNGACLNMSGVNISSNISYGVYNLGGTIESIRGGTIIGKNGIYNQNVRSGSQATEEGYQIDYVGKILDMSDVTIQVTQYGIYNRGSIGTIGGSTSITADTYAVYNDYYWYYDTIWNRYEQTDAGDRAYRTYSSGLARNLGDVTADQLIAGLKGEAGGTQIAMPSIARITGSTSIHAASTTASGHALYNRGYIGQIIGSTSISAGYRYALSVYDGGYVGLIGGSTGIYAANRYALYISGQLNVEYTGCRSAGYKTPEYGVEYTEYVPARVNTIHGSNVTIRTDNGYAIQVNAELGNISGKVTIETPTYGVVVNTCGAIESQDLTKTWADGVETNRNYVCRYAPATIGSIGASASDAVTITTTGAYGISNGGLIGTIGSGAVISSSQYAICNTSGRYDAMTQEVSSAIDSNVSDKYLTIYTRTYSHLQAEIETIDGTALSSTSTYTIRNYGHIGVLRNASVSSGANDYTVANDATGSISGQRTTLQYYLGASAFSTTTSQFNAINTGVVSYAEPSIGSIENCELTGKRYVLNNGGYIGSITGNTITASGTRAIQNTGKPCTGISYAVTGPAYDTATGKYTTTSTGTNIYEDVCTIDTIGAGNVIQATNETLYNSGRIEAIDSEDGERTRILTTSTGSSNVALYNIQGLALEDGNVSAYIGSICNTEIVGNAYAIKNGNGSADYPGVTIGKIGEGVVAVATRSTGYALHNNASNALVSLISGGDYYSGGKTREYAIYQPDAQIYPEGGYTLTNETREAAANGTTYNCYYIDIPKHTHTYGKPVDTWTVDSETGLASVTAAVTCPDCEPGTDGRILSETVTGIAGAISTGDCQTKGGTTYKAAITLNGADYIFEHFAENESYGDHKEAEAVKENEVPATCTQEGSYDSVVKCSVCGETLSSTHVTQAATGHAEEILDLENSVPADCENPGKNVYKCSVCGQTLREEAVSAPGHSYAGVVTRAPSCEEEGITTYTCSACGDSYTEPIEPTGHSWKEDETVYTPPNCTEPGSQGYVCEKDANHTKTEPIPASGHSYAEPGFVWAADLSSCTATAVCGSCGESLALKCDVNAEETKAATETEVGEMSYTASVTIGETVCTDSRTAEIPKLGHNYTETITKQPTCTEAGEKTFTCQNTECTERTYTEQIPATGHSYTGEVTLAATCTEAGVMTYTCSTCGDQYTEDISAAGHSYSSTDTVPAECEKPGTRTYACSACGDQYTEEIPALEHNWSEWSQVTAPGCTEAGQEVRSCSACGKEETKVVDATGHSYSGTDTVPAECEKPGTRTYACSACGDQYTEEIPALEHNWSEWSQVTAPSCTETGQEARSCSACGKEETKTVDASGHSWTQWQQIQAPTCEDAGQESRSCTVCFLAENQQIPAKGHAWDAGEVILEATCTQDGTIRYTCANDPEHTYEESIPAVGHSYGSVTTGSTCTEGGYTTYTCTVCGDSYVADQTDPLGHKYSGTVTTAPTCTDPGARTCTCTVCDDSYTEILAATGHSYTGQPAYAWAEDFSSCVATHTCGVCHQEQSVLCQVEAVRQEDKWVYTANASFGGQSYTDTQEVADVYRVTISWEQTQTAAYSGGTTTYTWDPRTMTYSAQNQGAGWMGSSRVEITVDNTGSNNGVIACFAYDPLVEGLATWLDLVQGNTLTVGSGATDKAVFVADPTGLPEAPEAGEAAIVLGTITITLEKEN